MYFQVQIYRKHHNLYKIAYYPLLHRTESNEAEIVEIGSLVKVVNDELKYFPLTLEQEVIVTTCITCLHTFCHATERLAHYGISLKCKQALDENPSQLDLTLNDEKNITCSSCQKVFENAWKFCLHRDEHRHFNKTFPCFSCTAVLWSAKEFVNHSCTSWFLNQSDISYIQGRDLRVCIFIYPPFYFLLK